MNIDSVPWERKVLHGWRQDLRHDRTGLGFADDDLKVRSRMVAALTELDGVDRRTWDDIDG